MDYWMYLCHIIKLYWRYRYTLNNVWQSIRLFKGTISLAETSPRLPRLISRGNSGDSGDQKMACALTKATSRRRLKRWQPIRPVVAGTSPRRIRQSRRRLRDVFLVAGTSPAVAALYISLAWRLGGDSSLRWLQRRLRDVSWRLAGSPGSRGKFKHVRLFWDFSSLQQVSETSPRRLRDLLKTSRERLLSLLGLQQVSETSPIPAGDWKKSPPKKIEHVSISRDSPETRLVSQRRHDDTRRLESPPSLQASEIGP